MGAIRHLTLVICGALCGFGGAANAAPIALPPPISVSPLDANGPARTISLDRMAFQLREGQVWARRGVTFACDMTVERLAWRTDSREWDLARPRAILRDEAVAAGFPVPSQNLFEDSSGGELRIGAAINNIDSRLCSLGSENGPTTVRGEMRLEIEWQVYDALERRVVATIPTSTGGVIRNMSVDGLDRLFNASFRESVRALLADPTLREVVTSPPGAGWAGSSSYVSRTLRTPPRSRRTIKDTVSSTVLILSDRGHGSGFVLSTTGDLLTNAHVVGTSKYVKVRWADGTEALGEVERRDVRRDIALVVVAPNTRVIPLSINPQTPAPGADVYAVGAPLSEELQSSVTRGVVSAMRLIDDLPFIQSDVTVNPGNSGGPLLNAQGEVVGVTVAALRPEAAPTGVNLFIPIGDALRALNLTLK